MADLFGSTAIHETRVVRISHIMQPFDLLEWRSDTSNRILCPLTVI
jgi:hypothetical protein